MRRFYKSHKLDHVCYDIRGPIMQTAKEMEEAGHHIIKLNIGNMAPFGFAAPEAIVQGIEENISRSAGYTDSKGIKIAREAVLVYAQKKGILNTSLEDIILGNGVSELITLSMNALLNPGDEVLLPAPDYPLWTASVSLASGTPIHYLCDEQQNWSPIIDDIKQKITPNTKAIVLINPNNPTGALYSREILLEILELARTHQLIIFRDEIYDQTIYEGEHTSIASLANDVFIMTFGGLSKNYRGCGYRAGWVMLSGNKSIARDYIDGLNMLASMRLCANVTGQFAIAHALQDQSIQGLIAENGRLRQQRDLAYQKINTIEGVSCTKPQAALYLFPKLDANIYPIQDDQEFVHQFLLHEKVLLVQGSGFHWPKPDHLRIVFLPEIGQLEEALTRFTRFLEMYRHQGINGQYV
jgi:alanine-synthesizing transaminase